MSERSAAPIHRQARDVDLRLEQFPALELRFHELFKRAPQPNIFTTRHAFTIQDGLGKDPRNAINRLVWDFRKDHKFVDGRESPRFAVAVNYYNALPVEGALAKQITKIASPRVYSSIRQAGRMRSSEAPLSEELLEMLSPQISAALTWRSFYDPAHAQYFPTKKDSNG